jgi:hypothetical protein
MIDLTLILAAGVASGTILLFAAVGEISQRPRGTHGSVSCSRCSPEPR